MKRERKIKVMIVSTVGLIYDGITSVILSYMQAMDLSGLEVYIAATIKVEPKIKEEMKKVGLKIVVFPSRRENPIQYFFEMAGFLRKNQIDIIHAHGNSGTLVIEMLAGWIGGCQERIAHSHNTKCDQVRADKILRPIFNRFYTKAVACGDEAGKWLFKDKPFIVLKNGRDIDKFSFCEDKRIEVRKEYGLANSTTIGHVGGFFPQKNHEFVLEIYRQLINKDPNVKMFFVGDGPLREKIENEAKGLENNIIFTGVVNNVQNLLQAMDAMVLPSLFEGLPLVAIEWQIAGLPCVLSDAISAECAITDSVHFCSLNETPKTWAELLLDVVDKNARIKNSEESRIKINEAGFNIRDNAEMLRKMYVDG